MKKVLLTILIILSIPLSGCSLFGNTKMIHKETLNVESLSILYDINDTTLNIYRLGEENYTDYVSVQEFLEMLDPALVDLKLKEGNTLTISISRYALNQPIYDNNVVLDPQENTIYIENFYRLLSIGSDYDLDYVFQFTSDTWITQEGGNSEVTIDLDDYNFTIEKNKKDMYIPLHVANLLFSGSLINVYKYEDKLYLVEDFSTFDTLKTKLPDTMDEQTIIEDTANYLSLVFDYFYGLKYFEDTNLTTDILWRKGIFTSETLTEQMNLINGLISNSSDLHTRIYKFGYNFDELEEVALDPGSELALLRKEYKENSCDLRGEEIQLTTLNDYYILELNGFTLDTKDSLLDSLEGIDSHKDIVIDLSCNLGGTVGGMFDTISFMTNEDFYVFWVNGLTEHQLLTGYTPYKQRGIENNFILYTSGVSYSAANVFTEITKTNQLGIVIGETTRGGGAIVDTTVLPNGMVLRYSSTRIYTDRDNESIEQGVTPNFSTDKTSVTEAMSSLYALYQGYFVTETEDNTYHNMVDVSFSVREFLHFPSDAIQYKVEILNADGSLRNVSYYDTNQINITHNAKIEPYFTIKLSVLIDENNTTFYIPIEEIQVYDPDNE